MPFFAISPAFLESLWSSYYKRVLKLDQFSKIVLSVQHKLFYLIMAFARFNLYANSYSFLYQKAFDTKRARGGNWAWRLEVAGILFFWSWFCRVLYGCGSWQMALAYFLVSHVVTSPLHIQVIELLNFWAHHLLTDDPCSSVPYHSHTKIIPFSSPDSIHSDRAITFQYAHRGPRSDRVLPSSAITHHD